MSISPGAMMQPETSRALAPAGSMLAATAAILPSLIATSNRPSTRLRSSMTRPPLRTRSKPAPRAVMLALRDALRGARPTVVDRASSFVVGRSGELDHPGFVDALLSGKHDTKAVDRRIHRLAQIDVLVDRLEEKRLFAIAQILVVRLIVHREDVVLLDESLVARRHLGVVILDCVGLGVLVDVGGVRDALLVLLGVGHDRHSALRADDIFHEVRDLAHHRSPTGFIPADRSVIERHVEMTVVLLVGLSPKLGADAVYAHWL